MEEAQAGQVKLLEAKDSPKVQNTLCKVCKTTRKAGLWKEDYRPLVTDLCAL